MEGGKEEGIGGFIGKDALRSGEGAFWRGEDALRRGEEIVSKMELILLLLGSSSKLKGGTDRFIKPSYTLHFAAMQKQKREKKL